MCFSTVVIGEVDPKKLGISNGSNKIREFSKKCVKDKRKLLVKELNTQVEELFLDSLDEVRSIYPKKRRKVLFLSSLV